MFIFDMTNILTLFLVVIATILFISIITVWIEYKSE